MDRATQGFQERMLQAMSAHPRCPAQSRGRLTWLRALLQEEGGLDVTLNTVHKWATGKSTPRTDKLRILARILDVDPHWLALGDMPGMSLSESRLRARQASAAAQALGGLLQLQGAAVAYPQASDGSASRAGVDLYLTVDGILLRVAVVMGQVTGRHVTYTVPTLPDDVRVLGLVARSGAALGDVAFHDLSGIARPRTPEGISPLQARLAEDDDAGPDALILSDGHVLPRLTRAADLLTSLDGASRPHAKRAGA